MCTTTEFSQANKIFVGCDNYSVIRTEYSNPTAGMCVKGESLKIEIETSTPICLIDRSTLSSVLIGRSCSTLSGDFALLLSRKGS